MIGLIAISMMGILSGCTLAKESAGDEEVSQDRLIGLFITQESIDGFDAEAYLEEHIGDLIGGKEVMPEDTSSKNRIYGEIDKKDSENPDDWEISFGEIEGINFFQPIIHEEGEEPFSMIFADEICDVNVCYFTTDEGDSVELTGTLYTIASDKEIVYYNNPVYQTAKGDIYVIPGMGSGLDGSSMGISMADSIEEEWNITNGKEKESGKTKITINHALSYKPLQIRIHQMDIDNQVIKTEEYIVGTLPEKMIMNNNTAYILVETEWDHPQKDDYVTRELYEREEEDTYIEMFSVTENGRLEKQSTEITFDK